jgi:hypothetical protein
MTGRREVKKLGFDILLHRVLSEGNIGVIREVRGM